MFEAIEQGRIKAVWILSTNPVVSLPNADQAARALAGCDLVVVSDCMAATDTGRLAHILLPAAAWGEKDGTVTNSERRISRQRPFRPAPGEARPDWWMVCEVARRMGFTEGFDFATPAAVFREHAALSGFRNDGSRDFDISGLQDLDDAGYDALRPVQWPVLPGRPAGTPRLFAEGGFFTPDRRARLLPIQPRPPQNATRAEFPMALNTGRVRDHWHTMTRTGLSPRLSVHSFEPTADLHPDDARRSGVGQDDVVRILSPWGETLARAQIAPLQRRGCVFVPMHWNGEYASRGRVNAAVNPAVDPVSGQPELKHTPVRVERFDAAWYGVALSRKALDTGFADYAVRGRGEGHWRQELAGQSQPDWDAWARANLAGDAADPEWVAYRDPAAGALRIAALSDGRLQGCLFVGRSPQLPPRAWLASLYGGPLTPEQRLSLMAGRPLQPGVDVGPIICSCFSVGLNRILAEIRTQAASSVEALGVRLKAGTNCGSCRPELARILRQAMEAA
jgi:assimilatory nitrate reductase catalytic subunit